MYCKSSCTENHFCKDLELVKILGLWSIVHILAEHICTIASNIHFLIKKCTIVFGTDPDRNGVLEETPRSWSDSYRWLSHLGVRAPYANQVWLNTTFISQGSRLWGKLAVETWRVKTELTIITILRIIIITTSILNLGFKTIAPKILAHTKCINTENIHKYLQRKIKQNHKILALAQNIGASWKLRRISKI